ncbi:MAG: macro domain-containing protein [Chthonomonadaceae bacterium]|nr:macro domain-containing protein [Chthonomonadaceae bacterium]
MSEVIYHLRDINAPLVASWSKYFAEVPQVRPSFGDVFGVKADAIISPANSFGFMDGGIDLVYSGRFGWQLQKRLQQLLREEYEGELPIGMAVLLGTGDHELPYLVSAPTMRAPANVSNTLNAFLAFRAALRLIQRHNALFPETIKSVICPGLATATGQMPVEICAKQMYAAYVQVVQGQTWNSSSINEIVNEHYRLLRVVD